MTDIKFDSWSRAYTMFDILNEPDSYGLTWPTVGPLYHQVMTAGYKINPCALRSHHSVLLCPVLQSLSLLRLVHSSWPDWTCANHGCVYADALYFVEGMAQGSLGSNWGDGAPPDVVLQKLPMPFYVHWAARLLQLTLGADISTRVAQVLPRTLRPSRWWAHQATPTPSSSSC